MSIIFQRSHHPNCRAMKSSEFFLIVSSVFMVIAFTTTETEATQVQQIPCTRSCGDIKIRYPFRLMGDPVECGDKDYELSCLNNQTILQFNAAYYFVKKISYHQRKVTVIDSSLASGSCSFPHNTITVRSDDNRYSIEDSDYYYYNQNYTHVQFLRCSSEISNSTYLPFPCLNQKGSYAYFRYVGVGSSSLEDLFDIPKSCRFVSSVFTHKDEIWEKSLIFGFNLSWSVNCKDCRLAGGSCSMRVQDDQCFKWNELNWVAMVILVVNILLRVDYILNFLLFYIFPFYIFPASIPSIWFLPVGSNLNSLELQFPTWLFSTFSHVYAHSRTHIVIMSCHALILMIVITTKIISVVALVGFLIHKYRNTWKAVDIVEKFLYNQPSLMPRRYSYAEIVAITGHLSLKLGQGGFGSVYKGQLLDGTLVAVKVLQNSKFNGEEFINEVSTIGRIHHSNIVQLVGFCSEGSKRALIYEYMSNGSLDEHIFSNKHGNQSFTWEKLYQIALGTARGIQYLHDGCDVCILHFDIKPPNILLDANFNPKVADFGLAKFHSKENDFICVSATRGTIGYIAPELISRNFGVISSKSDVYAFGMVLLEMAGGRKNSFARATRSSKEYFPTWAYDRIIEGRELEFQNASEIEQGIGRKLCMIGLWCIQVNPATRPSITKVLEMLEGNIEDLQIPPKPFFSTSSQPDSIEEIQFDSSTSSAYT